MLSFLFVSVVICTLVYFFYLCKISGINLLKPTIISLFLVMYILFAFIGLVPLFFGWDEYRVLTGVNDTYNILKLWFFSSTALFCLFLGFLFSNRIMKMNSDHNIITKDQLTLTVASKIILLLIFIICTFVLIIYITKLPAIPIVQLLLGATTEEIKVLRTASTTGFSGGYHWYALFFNSILTFLCFVTFAEVIKYKTRLNLLIFLIVGGVSFFAVVLPTHKAPAIWLIIGLIITYLIVKKRNISLKYLFLLSIISLPILILMYKFFMGYENRSILEIINNIFSRTLTGQLTPAYYYLEIFPEKIDYLLGRSFPNPGDIFPWEHFRITVEVMNYMNPSLLSSDVIGTAPAVFWAEMYANFGFFAIIISSIMVGVILYSIQYYILKLPITSVSIGLNVWLMLEFQKLVLTGLSSFFLNIDLFVIILIGMILIKYESKNINSNILERYIA